MRFSKTGDIYKVIRITGSQDNILGITFAPSFDIQSRNSNSIEVIEWEFENLIEESVKSSKQEVLDQVLAGLSRINSSLGTDYRLSKIYFCPFDSPKSEVYSGLIVKLIRHYHTGNKFEEN